MFCIGSRVGLVLCLKKPVLEQIEEDFLHLGSGVKWSVFVFDCACELFMLSGICQITGYSLSLCLPELSLWSAPEWRWDLLGLC